MRFFKIIFAAVFVCYCSGMIFAADSSKSGLLKSLEAAEKYNNKKMKYKIKTVKPFKIYDTGGDEWVDYEKYGVFRDTGTDKYKYVPNDFNALKEASGEGIYPNTQSVYNSPEYKKFLKNKKLEGDQWRFVNSTDYQANFYKWATTREEPGVKLYFTAVALERAGNYKHAVKAYYACLVFFPKSVGWTEYKTPWYIAPVCIDRIKYLTKKYPEIGVRLEGAEILIDNTFDNNTRNDVFYITPGKLIPVTSSDDFKNKEINLDEIGIKKTSGEGKVKLVEYNNGHFRITVDDKPYIVKGMSYGPNKVGLTPEKGLDNNSAWTRDDYDANGVVDGPFEAWVDANRNEKQDKNEPRVGDFALMKEMGVNTLRIYHHRDIVKDVLKEGYEKYGFMYIIGDFLGMYAVDSGATWEDGTDYSNPQQRENMLNSIRKMVEAYKDEPYVLMWMLGNENNYGNIGDTHTSSKVHNNPEVYYGFVDEVAKLIKSLDPQQRPVALCNGDLGFFDCFSKLCPNIDIYGANAYRGAQGFGNMWKDIKRFSGKPALITEYGCPAYAVDWSTPRIENGQSDYHKGCWENIKANSAGIDGGAGNSLGGVAFAWSDEWWKAQGMDADVHDTKRQFGGAFLDGGGYEEWFGICGIGEDGKDSTFKRYLRKVYFTYREIWNEEK